MKDGLDLGLVSSGSLVKRGYSFLIANVGKTVALITLAVSALVLFTKISFSELSSESFTGTLVMMLIASYVMYFSLEDAGERLGRDSDAYKAVKERYEEKKKSVKGHDLAALRKFCLDYREAELGYRRSNMLFSLGYTEEEYKSYLGGEKMSKKAMKDLGRVKKMKRAELAAASLLSNDKGQKSELYNPAENKLLRLIMRLIPSTVCMLFTVSVMISVKDNLGAAGVIEALVKLSTLPAIGLKGYSGGYEYVTESEIGWIETKSRLLDAFLKEYNKG
ncbi:MAG: hypothetical protein IJW53_00605 [Clostridia bacterium]|nr:hypothetical protein [Clostridia bacterium]